MASTDIDGSVIVILTGAEAHRIYEYLSKKESLDFLEQRLVTKIANNLGLIHNEASNTL